jgi:hypothetical protein
LEQRIDVVFVGSVKPDAEGDVSDEGFASAEGSGGASGTGPTDDDAVGGGVTMTTDALGAGGAVGVGC